MRVSYNWLQDYFEKDLPPPEKLCDLLTMHVFEVEGLEKREEDTVFDVKVLPDRARYALCHFGVAYEVGAITGLALKPERDLAVPLSTNAKPEINIADTGDCRRYLGRLIETIDTAETPTHIRERLLAIGQRSIHPVVDAANYVMFDVGQPLHAFDADKVKGTITVRHAVEGETITTLDGRQLALDSQTLVIADEEGALAIAGIKGGTRAGIDEHTTRLILESANFEPTTIRKTATRLGIATDASKRFENDISPEVARVGMDHFTKVLQDVYGESLGVGEVVDHFPAPPKETEITVTAELVTRLLGVSVPENEIAEIFERLRLRAALKDGTFSVHPPAWRSDLKIPEDLADEIGRLYGYEKVPATLPPKAPAAEMAKRFLVEQTIRETLVGLGFSEIMTSSFSSRGKLPIEKPLASDKAYGRPNIREAMAASLTSNAANAPLLGLADIRIFELGRVWPAAATEETHLALGYAASRTKTKGVVEAAMKTLSEALGITVSGTITEGVAEITLDGFFATAKLDASETRPIPPAAKKFVPFSSYPFIVRDIALFVPEETTEDMVWKEIEKGIGGGRDILANHYLFDTYRPKEGGKVSYAFRLVFQAFDRTLTDEQINEIMTALTAEMEKMGWQVR